jgi:hypothetical protein
MQKYEKLFNIKSKIMQNERYNIMDTAIVKSNLYRMHKLTHRLEQAEVQLQAFFPIDTAAFNPDALSVEMALFLDGFRARFADLQDMLGNAMFKTIALMDEDENPAREMTTRERTALMEKRGLIEIDQWHRIREVRNGFAHEYPDEHVEKATLLNHAWELVPVLLAVSKAVSDYCKINYGINVDKE